jgi:hypothetical protein
MQLEARGKVLRFDGYYEMGYVKHFTERTCLSSSEAYVEDATIQQFQTCPALV